MLSETEKRKQRHEKSIFHINIMLNLGFLAALLWVNIPGIGGTIAGCTVIGLILFYPFVAFNQKSWLNIWIDGVMHRINMKSLERSTGEHDRRNGIIFISIGFIDIIGFYILFYLLELPILACLCIIIGKLLKFSGFIKLYQSTETIEGQRILVIVLGLCAMAYPWHIMIGVGFMLREVLFI